MRLLSKIYTTVVAVSGLLLTAALTLLCLAFRVFITMDTQETFIISRNSLLILPAAAIGLLLLLLLQRVTAKIPVGALYIGLAVLYLIAGTLLIYVADVTLRADQERIFHYALQFSAGDYEGLLPNKYLGWNPHQLGILTWERLFLAIHATSRALYMVNLGLVILINGLLWKTVELLTDGDAVCCRNAVLLSFLFLPQFFYILFVYGQIPGLFFTWAAVVLLLLWVRNRRMAAIPGCALCCAMAALLKPNYGIAVIAIGLTVLACFLRERRKDLLLGLVLLTVLTLSARPLLNRYYERVSGMQIAGGIPVISYVVMGLQEEGEEGPTWGWFNSYNVDVYAENHFDSEAAAAVSRRDLEERVHELFSHPDRARELFAKKVISTWCDPLFESIWVGPLPAEGQTIHPRPLTELYSGEGAYPYLAAVMNVFNILLFGSSAVFLFFRFRENKVLTGSLDPILLLPVLYLLGGFVYHLISETSSQYVYMYVYGLIPYLASGIRPKRS